MPFGRIIKETGGKKCFSMGAGIKKVFRRAFKGSLTVESAAVLPVFLFAMISLIHINEVIRYSDIVSSRLHQNARQMAVAAYVAQNAGLEGINSAGSIGGIALSYTVVDSDVRKNLTNAGITPGPISYLRSQLAENDIIDIAASEEIRLPFDFMGIGRFTLTDRARVHAFTGFDPTSPISGTDRDGNEEEQVYITSSGSVYHRSRNCPHLNVKPRQISSGELSAARSASGGRYYPCEYCRKSSAQGAYYITDYGDRYHTSVTCQGLKRDITQVPLSEVQGRSPCKTCGR